MGSVFARRGVQVASEGSVHRLGSAEPSASTQRLASLRSAFPHGDMPPIEAYEVAGAFFVSDGHHRVALALERSADFIDAEITRLETSFEIGPDVDVRQQIHTEQQPTLMQDSGLARARPDVVVEFSRPGGYPELLELIKAHGYDLARQRGKLPHAEEQDNAPVRTRDIGAVIGDAGRPRGTGAWRLRAPS